MDTQENTQRKKAQIALRAGIVFAFLFALTWGLPFSFAWIFFWASGYSFFLFWFYQPRVASFERTSQSEFQHVSTADRIESIVKRVIRISGIIVVGSFALFFVYGIFVSKDDQTTQPLGEDESSMVIETDEATAWNETGYNFYLNKQYDSALFYFERVLRLESGNGQAWYNKGMVYYDQQQMDKALESFSRAYDAGIRDAFLSHVLGYLNDVSGNTSRAIGFYKEAVGMDSSRSDIYTRLAELEPSMAARYNALQEKWKQ